MVTKMPTVHHYPCPKCGGDDMAIRIRLPAASQDAVLSLCGCYAQGVRIGEAQEILKPHETVVTAARRIAAGKAVRFEGHSDPCATLQDLFTVCSDVTQPLGLCAITEPEPVEAKTAEESTGEDEDLLLFDTAGFRPEDENELSKFNAALEYIRCGYPIVLLHGVEGNTCTCGHGVHCPNPGKHPVGKRWAERAISSKEKLAKRWHNRRGQPTNIGILLHEDWRSLLIDVDKKKGKDGAKALGEWGEALGIRFDDYLMQNTPSGGEHYLFRVPEVFDIGRLPNRANVAPGVDVLRHDRQFVVSPSETPKGRYGMEGNGVVVLPPLSEVPEAPQALLEHLASLASERNSGIAHEPLSETDLELLQAPSAAMVREAVKHIPNDERYDAREKWIGMAYRIRTACGQGNEAEARETFLEFSDRWRGGEANPDEAARVFDTLNKDQGSGGWPALLWMAMEQGFEVPYSVVTAAAGVEAQFEFDVDPTATPPVKAVDGPIARALQGTGLSEIRKAPWDRIPDILGAVRAELSSLSPGERAIVRAIAEGELHKRLSSGWAAQTMLRSFLQSDGGHDPFTYDSAGVARLQTLGEQDIDLDAAYVVDGLIPAGAVGALIADYSLGKTWLVVDLALSVAFGRTWFRRQTREQPVIFVIAEGNQSFPKRLFGWLHEQGILPEQVAVSRLLESLKGRALISRYPLQFDHLQFESGLIATIQQINAGLVIFDTLGKSLGAEQSENDNDTANTITGMLSRIVAKTGCTCLFTHHTGYQDQARGRGASAWTQGLDFAYRISGTRDGFKGGRPVQLVPLKFRDDQWPDVQRFRLKSIPDLVLVAPDGEEISTPSAVIEPELEHDFPSVDNVDLKRYTTAIESGENTQALHLALGVLLGLEEINGIIEDTPRVSKKDFLTNYNGHLERTAQQAHVEGPKLKDTYAKALLAQLCGHTPPLIRKDGRGRATGYLVTDVGKRMAARTVDEFDRWWKEHVRTDNADGNADEEDS